VISTRFVNSPLKTRRERGLVSRLLFTFLPGGFAGSYFYHSYNLISVKHHKVKISKDTDGTSVRIRFLNDHILFLKVCDYPPLKRTLPFI
jgi:hypothetical protein